MKVFVDREEVFIHAETPTEKDDLNFLYKNKLFAGITKRCDESMVIHFKDKS